MTEAALGITMGDPAGIGPEIILKCFEAGLPHQCVVYGDVAWLERLAVRLKLNVRIVEVDTPCADLCTQLRSVPVIQACDPVPASLTLGQVSAVAGMAAYQSLQLAIDDALMSKLRAIVTAPLNKQAIHLAGIDFAGHTEILAHRCGGIPVAMMLVNDSIRVLLVTIHEPLAKVPSLITPALELQAITLASQACQQLGISHPRVAVAGLNPHAGESGKFGEEEVLVIAPAIEAARGKGINASGPWPGDTIFSRARQGEFDIVVAQYHDQGLIPVKYLGIDEGVNVTVGLPFIRTSVDHGTAFDIADKGIASPDSLKQAIDLAARLSVANQKR
jgi:4-hydroxythreonine-4-phosphate dehydrogenase